jgi:hypothetical protein
MQQKNGLLFSYFSLLFPPFSIFHYVFVYFCPHQDVLVTRAQVQTLYQQQTPHLQSNTQTHLDIRHSTLWYNIQFKH